MLKLIFLGAMVCNSGASVDKCYVKNELKPINFSNIDRVEDLNFHACNETGCGMALTSIGCKIFMKDGSVYVSSFTCEGHKLN